METLVYILSFASIVVFFYFMLIDTSIKEHK